MPITDFLKDLLAAGVPEVAAKVIADLGNLEPSTWKGNKNGEKDHFENIEFSCGAGMDDRKFWTRFKYEDNGTPHELFCTCPLDQIGKRGGDDIIELDGEAVENDDFVISARTGWGPLTQEDGTEGPETGWYRRVVMEYKFTKDGAANRYRFDGDK